MSRISKYDLNKYRFISILSKHISEEGKDIPTVVLELADFLSGHRRHWFARRILGSKILGLGDEEVSIAMDEYIDKEGNK